MGSKAGISGVAVAAASLGGVLVYAGFRGINPMQALREIGSGKPPAITSHPAEFDATMFGSAVGTALNQVGSVAPYVMAASRYEGDKYSQARRQQTGYSDCSSFCDKVFHDVGMPTPFSQWANTSNYRMSPDWRTIPASQSKPGDIAISSHHMVLVLGAGGSAAIGQQNPRVNVRRGTVANLMGGQTYVYKTFVGKR